MSTAYCTPSEAGKQSEARMVGNRIGRMLDALGDVNRWVCEGAIVADCEAFADGMRRRLRADGWRIKVNARDRWTVLPPKDYHP